MTHHFLRDIDNDDLTSKVKHQNQTTTGVLRDILVIHRDDNVTMERTTRRNGRVVIMSYVV